MKNQRPPVKRKKFYTSDELWDLYKRMEVDPDAALILKEQVEKIITVEVAKAMKPSYGSDINFEGGYAGLEDSNEWTTLEAYRDKLVDGFLYGPKAVASKTHSDFENLLRIYTKRAIYHLGDFNPVRYVFNDGHGSRPACDGYSDTYSDSEAEEVSREVLPGTEFQDSLHELDPARIYEAKAIREEFLASLPKRERLVIEMLERGCSYEDVRLELGLSDAALKNIVYRLRKEAT